MRSSVVIALGSAVVVASCARPAPRVLTNLDVTTLKGGNLDLRELTHVEDHDTPKASVICVIGETGALDRCRIEKLIAVSDSRHGAYERIILEFARTTRVDVTAKDGSDARGQMLRLDIRFTIQE